MNDHDERTFAPLPPARGRAFTQTWWGRAWLKALEDAALDTEQVKAGRRLARAGAVGAVTVRPGRVTAVLRDRDGTAHRADVLLQRLSEGQWDRFLDIVAERAGHLAALLDHEMPPHLVEDAEAAGVELLPGLGDLEAECDCGAWDHCAHTAALCHQMARLMDQDPFVLLLMRGRGEREVLDALQTRGMAREEEPQAAVASAQEGVDAAEAYMAGDILPPLPALPDAPRRPGTPPSLDCDTPAVRGVDPAALEYLAARTAEEAHRLLVEAHSESGPKTATTAAATATVEPTLRQDAVRLGAGHPGPAIAGRLAQGSGRDRTQWDAAVRAWGHGGAAALEVLEEEWTPNAAALARARAALEAWREQDGGPRWRESGNRWTAVGAPVQVRLGRDGRWWPYREEEGRWVPVGPAAQDPATALAVAGGEE